ncbi:MAG: hypothetical protein EOO82_02985 [Oxalobacteraceae bacterium]|nr:MAG: hypothetical protein EOO82_02985 [Oxalobacteraceae bacterium]
MLTEAEHLVFAHLHAHAIDVEVALQLIHAGVFVAQPVPWETIDDWQPEARSRFEHCGWIGRLGNLTPHVILENLEADITASREADVYVAASFDFASHAVVPFGSLPRSLHMDSDGVGYY